MQQTNCINANNTTNDQFSIAEIPESIREENGSAQIHRSPNSKWPLLINKWPLHAILIVSLESSAVACHIYDSLVTLIYKKKILGSYREFPRHELATL